MFVHKKNSLDNSGQSLVEVLVAITVGVFVVVALINAAVAAMRNAQYAKNQNIATKLAQEGMEQVRGVRDRIDWNTFVSYSLSCYGAVDTTTWSLVLRDNSCIGSQVSGVSGFRRVIWVESVVDGKMKVVVKVFWIDAAGKHSSELVSFLTKWAAK